MYHYLTGAASWYMLTVITQMYGIRGELGSLLLQPKLQNGQFDETGTAEISLLFGNRKWKICYRNPQRKEEAAYRITQIILNGTQWELSGREDGEIIDKTVIEQLPDDRVQQLEITLG